MACAAAVSLARHAGRRAAATARARAARAGGSSCSRSAGSLWVYDAINNLAPLRLARRARARARHPLHVEQHARHRPRARARPLARRAPHARRRSCRLLRQRALHRHARPARLPVVVARRPLSAAAQLAGAGQRDRLRRVLALSGRARRACSTASPTSSPRRMRSARGTRARSPRRPTSSRRCRRCTWPGPAGARLRCGGSARAAGCAQLALLYPCLTALAVLATGNHFVLDIVGGLLALALVVAATTIRRGGAACGGAGARTSARRRGDRLKAPPRRALAPARGACHKVVTKFNFG